MLMRNCSCFAAPSLVGLYKHLLVADRSQLAGPLPKKLSSPL